MKEYAEVRENEATNPRSTRVYVASNYVKHGRILHFRHCFHASPVRVKDQ